MILKSLFMFWQCWSVEVGAPVTSLSLKGKLLLVGTSHSEIYEIFLGPEDELFEALDPDGYPLVLDDYSSKDVEDAIKRQESISSTQSKSSKIKAKNKEKRNKNSEKSSKSSIKYKCNRPERHDNFSYIGSSNNSHKLSSRVSSVVENFSVLGRKSSSNQRCHWEEDRYTSDKFLDFRLSKETPPLRLLSTCNSESICDITFPR